MAETATDHCAPGRSALQPLLLEEVAILATKIKLVRSLNGKTKTIFAAAAAAAQIVKQAIANVMTPPVQSRSCVTASPS
jgi:hypothetical protein